MSAHQGQEYLNHALINSVENSWLLEKVYIQYIWEMKRRLEIHIKGSQDVCRNRELEKSANTEHAKGTHHHPKL